MFYWIVAHAGPKGKIITGYDVRCEGNDCVQRFTIRKDGRGSWRHAKYLANCLAHDLSNKVEKY